MTPPPRHLPTFSQSCGLVSFSGGGLADAGGCCWGWGYLRGIFWDANTLSPPPVYFRALVNFTHSIDYSPRLEDANSDEFREVSEAVVDTVSGARQGGNPQPRFWWGAPKGAPSPPVLPLLQLESEYYKIPGDQMVNVVFIK